MSALRSKTLHGLAWNAREHLDLCTLNGVGLGARLRLLRGLGQDNTGFSAAASDTGASDREGDRDE
jgi:hypothetical protein